MPDRWEVVSSKVALSNPWITVRQDTVRLPNGLLIEDYNVTQQADFAVIFGVTGEREVVFVRQYKHGVGDFTLELPSGFIGSTEEPSAAAERELREETGYSGSLRLVAKYIVNPTRECTAEYVFFGHVSPSGPQQLDEAEDIEVILIPASSLRAMIDRGEITVLSTLATCLLCLPLIEGPEGGN